MEENLEKLREIGIKQIAKDTRISISRVENILNKKFDSIQRVHLVGFLQILERQYKMDLLGLLEEFDQYQKQNSKESNKDKVEVKDLSLDTQKSRYDAIDDQKKQVASKQKFYITIVVVVIVVLLYLIYQNLIGKKAEQEGEVQTTQVIADENQNEAQNETNTEDDSTASSEPEIIESDTQSSKDSSRESSRAESKASQTSQANQTNSESQGNELVVTTNMQLWLDIVDLDTKKRKYQGVTSDTYTIKSENHRLLLAFGHSNFALSIDGQNFDFDKGNFPLYFIYEPDNGLKKIDNATYKRLAEQAR